MRRSSQLMRLMRSGDIHAQRSEVSATARPREGQERESRRDDLSFGRGILDRLLANESGHTLPAALWAIAIGALMIGPFLAHVSTSLIAGKEAEGEHRMQYAADAGIEFGLWKLLNDPAFRSQVDASPGTPIAIAPPIVVNQITTQMTAEVISAAGGWEAMANAPEPIGAGAALAYAGGDCIYAFRGNNTDQVGCYSISGDSWSALASAPGAVGPGGALAYTGGDYIYALRGNDQKDFWRYRISGNSWQVMQSVSQNIGAGGSLAFPGGDDIYALRGGGNRNHWYYSISSDNWRGRMNPPADVAAGGAMAYTGGDDIYAFRGGSSTDFQRYSISNNSWYAQANTPANVDAGGSLAYNEDGTIYALRGDNASDFWSYDAASDTWSPQPSTPGQVGAGGALVHTGNGTFYAFAGRNGTDFWRFPKTSAEYELVAQADTFSIRVRVEFQDSNTTILSWDIE